MRKGLVVMDVGRGKREGGSVDVGFEVGACKGTPTSTSPLESQVVSGGRVWLVSWWTVVSHPRSSATRERERLLDRTFGEGECVGWQRKHARAKLDAKEEQR